MIYSKKDSPENIPARLFKKEDFQDFLAYINEHTTSVFFDYPPQYFSQSFLVDIKFKNGESIVTGGIAVNDEEHYRVSPTLQPLLSAYKKQKGTPVIPGRDLKYIDYFNLPNGCRCHVFSNEVGGRTYTSDEVGGGVVVWDTALVNETTLLAAIVHEKTLVTEEIVLNRQREQGTTHDTKKE